MTKSSDDVEGILYCPICQVPLKILKIKFSVHINMCDVDWSNLQDCSAGISCDSESLFHFRDYSHQVLATHRENLLNKRKLADEDIKCDTKKSKQKENKLAKKKASCDKATVQQDEDEEEIFVCTKKTHVSVRKTTTRRKTESGKCAAKTTKNKTDCDKYHESEPSETPKCVQEESGDDGDKVLFAENECSICSEETHTAPELNSDVEGFDISVTKSIDIACEKKEKCKAKWKDIFRSSSKEEPTVEQMLENLSSASCKKKKKSLPYYKKIPGTGFAVDAFQYGSIPEVTAYFLSHFHSDHYIGLKKSFAHPLYCSSITANLVMLKLKVSEQYIRILKCNEVIIINQVEIECFDANHCPGSLIILFRLLNGEQYLHVGDFRASTDMEREPILLSAQITRLYLDTTYFDPQYVFPTQEEVVDRVRQIVREKFSKHPKALFITGTYLIGKEKVFLGILDELKCKLWALPPKRDILRCLNNETINSTLTSDLGAARVHVLPMNHLRFDKLKQHLLDSGPFSHVFAFKPTGWEMGRNKLDDWINVSSHANITIYGVPYSEHSSYEELCRFINFVKADKVIPTVPLRNREMYGHLKTIVDSYKINNGINANLSKQPKQQSMRQYVSQ